MIPIIHSDIKKHYSNFTYMVNGTYGHIINAIDNETNKKVVIKKVKLFNEENDIHPTVLLEITTLQKLRGVKGIIQLDKIFYHGIYIYYVLPYYKYNLLQFINNPLTQENKLILIRNISTAVANMHLNKFVHRDLKPENIVLNDVNDVVIIDFGFSVYMYTRDELLIEEELQTLHYRAPECLFYMGMKNKYRYQSDIWSLGCIIFKILTGLTYIFSVIKDGELTEKSVALAHVQMYGYDTITATIGNIPDISTMKYYKTIGLNFENTCPVEASLLNHMFELDITKRATILDVLSFFSQKYVKCPILHTNTISRIYDNNWFMYWLLLYGVYTPQIVLNTALEYMSIINVNYNKSTIIVMMLIMAAKTLDISYKVLIEILVDSNVSAEHMQEIERELFFQLSGNTLYLGPYFYLSPFISTNDDKYPLICFLIQTLYYNNLRYKYNPAKLAYSCILIVCDDYNIDMFNELTTEEYIQIKTDIFNNLIKIDKYSVPSHCKLHLINLLNYKNE